MTNNLIEQYLKDIKGAISKLDDKVDKINTHGCAHRKSDLQRIERLEGWRDKGIIGIIAVMVGLLLQYFGLNPK